MRKIKLISLVTILALSYSCKEVKKEAKEASDEMEETMKDEVTEEVIKFTMEPKSDSNVCLHKPMARLKWWLTLLG
jgi:Cu-Zn family superoxide dismutase